MGDLWVDDSLANGICQILILSDSRNDPVAVSGAEIGWRPKEEQREIRHPFDGASVARMTGWSLVRDDILERYGNRKCIVVPKHME